MWGLPRSTHDFFVEHLLVKGLRSARQHIMSQYVGFLKRLGKSVSSEVRIMKLIAAQDIRSVTGRNFYNLREEFSVHPWQISASSFNKVYKQYELPVQDRWRLSYLMDLLKQKYEMQACDEKTDVVTDLIESLCSS